MQNLVGSCGAAWVSWSAAEMRDELRRFKVEGTSGDSYKTRRADGGDGGVGG